MSRLYFLFNHFLMYLYPLMIIIHLGSGIEIAHGLFLVPQAQMSECHQIITMDTILLVHIIFPNLQVW